MSYVTQRRDVSKCCWKNVANRLAQHKVAKSSVVKKYLGSTNKQSIIKQSLIVSLLWSLIDVMRLMNLLMERVTKFPLLNPIWSKFGQR